MVFRKIETKGWYAGICIVAWLLPVSAAVAAAAIDPLDLTTVLQGRGATSSQSSVVHDVVDENFGHTTYQDPRSVVSGWGDGSNKITLPAKLLNGVIAANVGLGSLPGGYRVPYAIGADFTNDGLADLVGFVWESGNCSLWLGINQGVQSSTLRDFDFGSGANRRTLMTIPGATGDDCGNREVLVPGNFDGVNGMDFIHITLQDPDAAGTVASCRVYLSRIDLSRSSGQLPAVANLFGSQDCSPALTTTLSWHFRGPAMAAADWNGDGLDDLVVGTSSQSTQQVLLFLTRAAVAAGDTTATVTFTPRSVGGAVAALIPNTGITAPIAAAGQAASTTSDSCNSASTPSRGISMVAVGDFDNDSDSDLLVGSVSEDRLHYWKNDGADHYPVALKMTLPFAEGGPAFPVVADFTGDGYLDVAVARNGRNSRGLQPRTCGTANGAGLWLYVNDGAGNFTRSATAAATLSADADWLAGTDFDGDKIVDVLLYDDGETAPDSAFFSLSRWLPPAGDSSTLVKYHPFGIAVSKVVSSLVTSGSARQAAVAFYVKNLSVPNYVPGMGVQMFASNNRGFTWEKLEEWEQPPLAGAGWSTRWHEFTRFGNEVRWQAALSAPFSTTNNVAQVSPEVNRLQINVKVSTAATFSRSGLSFGELAQGSPATMRPFLIKPYFEFPCRDFNQSLGFCGHLTTTQWSAPRVAETLTTDIISAASLSSSRTGEWDAGALLKSRPGSDRIFYTAGLEPSTQRYARVQSLASSGLWPEEMQAAMGVEDGRFSHVLDFVRGGCADGDGWKLLELGRAAPLFVGAPKLTFQDATTQASYASFQSQWKSREPMVYLGANDGFLHAFAMLDGAERWVFVPQNLLAVLRRQGEESGANATTYLPVSRYFVDGPVVVSDVFGAVGSAVSSWRTLLFAGQGKGQGVQGKNYYFGLDITDPSEPPQPLWQFSDSSVDNVASCTTLGCSATGLDKCCPYSVAGELQEGESCVAQSVTCPTLPDSVQGETWFPPLPVRVTFKGQPRWVLFVASGYNNRGNRLNVGRTLYMLDPFTGEIMDSGRAHWTVPDLPYSAGASGNPSTLPNALRGGAAAVDLGTDDVVDVLYFGDLEGRLWKIDTTQNYTTKSSWPFCVLFDAGVVASSGQRRWAPIGMRPAVSIVKYGRPTVFFGTGGDDRAPDDEVYQFYAVYDEDPPGTCRNEPKIETDLRPIFNEWVVNGAILPSPSTATAAYPDNPPRSDKFWYEPLLPDAGSIYFASIRGKIDSVDPDASQLESRLFAYAVRDHVDQQGVRHLAGQSLWGANQPFVSLDYRLTSGPMVVSSGATQSWFNASLNNVNAAAQNIVLPANQLRPGQAAIILPHQGYVPPTRNMRLERWREIPL